MPHHLSEQRLKRARLALFVIFFTQGITSITTLPRIPELIGQIDVNFAAWGAIMGFGGLGALVPLVFTNRLVARFGTSPIINASALATVLALISQAWVTSPFLFFLIVFFQSFSLSTFNIALNSQAVMLQNQLGRVIIGSFHGAWSIGAAVSAALSGWLAGFMPLWLHLLIVPIACGVLFLWAGSQLLKPSEDGHASEGSRDRGVSWLKTPKHIWILSLGLFAGMFPELVIMDWTAVFSRDVLRVDATLGAIPYTVFVTAMIIGRFASAPLTKRIHFSTMSAVGGFVGSAAMALGTFVPAAMAATDPIGALWTQAVFYAVAGLGIASMVPSFYTAAGEVSGLSLAQALSRMSLANALFAIVAKTLMGGLVEVGGLVSAMIFPLTTFVAAGAISVYVSRHSRRYR
jgi:MFS family permease